MNTEFSWIDLTCFLIIHLIKVDHQVRKGEEIVIKSCILIKKMREVEITRMIEFQKLERERSMQ
jgi:hypothetical protein